MRAFLGRWYGDRRCPSWTWPGTISAIGVAIIIALLINEAFLRAACEKKGGNAVKHDGCYLVTSQKID